MNDLLLMIKHFPLLLFIGLTWGQDTVKIVSGQILIGKFIKTTENHIVFQESFNKEQLLIVRNNVADIIIGEDNIFKRDCLYLKNKKHPGLALILTYFTNITGIGHLYAWGWDINVWLRSVPFSSILVSPFVMIYNGYGKNISKDEGRVLLLLYSGTYIAFLYDSVIMAQKYNIRLHNQTYDSYIQTIPELRQFESELILRVTKQLSQ